VTLVKVSDIYLDPLVSLSALMASGKIPKPTPVKLVMLLAELVQVQAQKNAILVNLEDS